jgi:septum site-determining protein MinC
MYPMMDAVAADNETMPTSTESTHQSNPEPGVGGKHAPARVVAPQTPAIGSPQMTSDAPGAHNGEEPARNGVHHGGTAPSAVEDGAVAQPDASLSTQPSPDPAIGKAVRIRGRAGGVAVEVGAGEWAPLVTLLGERLDAADGFFRGGRVILDVGARSLDETHLRQVEELLERHAMRLTVVVTTDAATIDAALALGVSTTTDVEEGEVTPQPVAPAPRPAAPSPPPTARPIVHEPISEPLPPQPQHYVHRGSLRSGQVLRKTESIVIIGDVNPGAQVISGGDVMVWGRLRGVAHAGADGNRQAVVAALDFVPTQLRIAKLTTVPPEQKRGRGLFFWRKQATRRPEIARILDGKIVVEPWDETRTYGTSVLRR